MIKEQSRGELLVTAMPLSVGVVTIVMYIKGKARFWKKGMTVAIFQNIISILLIAHLTLQLFG